MNKMNNSTVNNMKLIILEMKKKTHGRDANFRDLKTLSNSYQTLLKQLLEIKNELVDLEIMNELEQQLYELINLKEYLDTQSIPELLSFEQYVDVNHITTTTTKLYDAINEVRGLLVDHIYPKHRKHILIFGSSKAVAFEAIEELLTKSGEKTIKRTDKNQGTSIVTKSNSFYGTTYHEGYRGFKCDELYIENNLSLTERKKVLNAVKSHSIVVYF